jgi:exodeoxyribonuclease VII small subunit
MDKQLSYSKAIERINAIVEQIEHQEPDVDTLTQLVEEATALILACKEQLQDADAKISETLEKLG